MVSPITTSGWDSTMASSVFGANRADPYWQMTDAGSVTNTGLRLDSNSGASAVPGSPRISHAISATARRWRHPPARARADCVIQN